MRLQRPSQILKTFLRSETGQTLPVVALMMVVLLAMVGIVVDVGHVYLCHRELQSSSDAAALAGAEMIPASNDPAAPTPTTAAVIAAATLYSSSPGGKNLYTNMSNVQMVSGYPKLTCLTTMQAQGISCVGPLQYNTIQVMQQATVNLNFAWIVGKPSITITAAATASKGGASSRPYNVAIVLDTTLSMNAVDNDCGNTQMLCVLNGVQLLMQHLDPCGSSYTNGCQVVSGNAINSVVRISIFTFPQVTTATVSQASNCSSTEPTATTYTFPIAGAGAYVPLLTTYQIVPFNSDYRVSDFSTSLNPTSQLTKAVGGAPSCTGMGPPSNAGNYGTYYGATLYAAQAALVAEQTQFPDSQNVMIILGDGDSNAPATNGPYVVMGAGATNLGTYPSWYGECGQAITAAKLATSQGTRVYSVAYGASSSGCQYDQSGQGHAAGAYPNVSACNTMAQMASAPYYFFSDYKQTGSASTCTAAQTMVSLSDIFLQIAGDLTVARLIPNGTT